MRAAIVFAPYTFDMFPLALGLAFVEKAIVFFPLGIKFVTENLTPTLMHA